MLNLLYRKELYTMPTYTIATHNGSVLSQGHNRREEGFLQSHINPDGKHETWFDVPLRQAYKDIFGEALAEYNSKQTRDDRKIKDYYKKIENDSRKHVAYEMIFSVGNISKHPSEDVSYAILKDVYEHFRIKYHKLIVVGAYYHADEEGVPHLHLDYVPVATGFKNGMSKQNSLGKALNQMGFYTSKGKGTAQMQFQNAINNDMELFCMDYGIDVEHPQKDSGVKHEMLKEMYILKRDINNLTYQKEQLKIENTSLQEQNKELIDLEKHLRTDIEQLNLQRQGLKDNCKKFEFQVNSLKSQKNELEDEVYEATKSLDSITAEYNKMSDTLKDYDTRVEIAETLTENEDLILSNLDIKYSPDEERFYQFLENGSFDYEYDGQLPQNVELVKCENNIQTVREVRGYVPGTAYDVTNYQYKGKDCIITPRIVNSNGFYLYDGINTVNNDGQKNWLFRNELPRPVLRKENRIAPIEKIKQALSNLITALKQHNKLPSRNRYYDSDRSR